MTGKLQEKLERIQEDREGVQARLKELSNVEEQARRLRKIPRLVEEYLTDLPYLIDRMPIIREHETIPAGRTPDNPLGIYELTPDSIRSKGEEELEVERRAALEARRDRFREIYTALGLTVVCYQDRSLEIRWGDGCSVWRRGTAACCRA